MEDTDSESIITNINNIAATMIVIGEGFKGLVKQLVIYVKSRNSSKVTAGFHYKKNIQNLQCILLFQVHMSRLMWK